MPESRTGKEPKHTKCHAAVALALAASFGAAAAAEPSERRLEAVTVTSTRTERPVEDVPGTVSVIGEARIEHETMRDITDLVRYEPGVSVGNTPGRFGPNSFTIRGIGGNRVLMQVDGIRMPEAFSIGSFSSASRNVVDLDAVKAVEILRGPGSSLYGSDAIGGVVTFITRDPADYLKLTDKPVFASIKGGYATADDGWLVTGTIAAGRGDLQGMAVYTHRSGHETENQGAVGGTGALRTEPNPQSYDDGNFLGKLVYRLNARHRIRLTAEQFSEERSTQVLTLNPATPLTSFLTGDDRSKRDRLSIEHEHTDPDGRLFQLARWQLYYQDSEASQFTFERRADALFSGFTGHCSGTAPGTRTCDYRRTFDYRQRTFGASAQLEKVFEGRGGSHHLTYGADLSRTRTSEIRNGVVTITPLGATTSNIAPDNFPVRDFPESDTMLSGLFVQDEVRIGALSLIPGLRYDAYRLDPKPDAIFIADNPGITAVEKKEDALSPKIGVLYRLTPRYTLYGQYAYGFRAPPFNDVNVGFTNLAFGYTAIPNPDLKPEKSRGLEVGLRGRIGRASFSLAGFYNRYKDFISPLQALDCPGDPRCVPGLVTFQSVNLGRVRIRGIEARGELPLGNGFGLIGAASFAEGEDTDRGQPLNSIDPPKLVAGLTYDAPGRAWGGQLVGTFVDGKKHIDQTTAPVPLASPGYAVFDLIGYWNASKRGSLHVGLFNLTDRKYFLWSDLQGLGGGAAGIAGPAALDRFSQPGRNLRVTYKHRF